MNLNPRLSFLASIVCAFSFLFSPPTASAAKKKEKVVGVSKVDGGGTFRINDKTVADGTPVRCGDVLETKESVQITLDSGKVYVVEVTSRVRLVCQDNGAVLFLVIFGGVHTVGADVADTVDPLPYLAAFGFGNFSFPSIGGGNSATNGKIPIFNSKGVVVGYALTDSNGRVISFTDLSGRVLAFAAPNGTPVSSVFGPGATGATLL